MPKREVTSAPWVPVPARAYTGKAPRARQHRAVGRLSAGAPRLHKSCRWRRPQSKGRSCVSGRARWDLRVRGGRGHLSERPGWPSGAPISRGSTVSMIAFGGRRGPHRSGSRCRGRPIERREAGREGCLWPNAASQGRPPDGSGGESERSTPNGRAKTFGGGGGSNSELPQAGFPESGEVPSVLFVSGVFILGAHETPAPSGFLLSCHPKSLTTARWSVGRSCLDALRVVRGWSVGRGTAHK